MQTFEGVKVFSATMAVQREQLGDRITDWIKRNPNVKVLEVVVKQSSDAEFHCLSLIVFFAGKVEAVAAPPPRVDDLSRRRSDR
jgi:hypothetical protein